MMGIYQFAGVLHRALHSSELQARGIDMLPGYKDPYSDRVLTKGEIGCFLSHHDIWEQVRSDGLRRLKLLRASCCSVSPPSGGSAGTAAGARAGGRREVWAQLHPETGDHHGRCTESRTGMGPHVSALMQSYTNASWLRHPLHHNRPSLSSLSYVGRKRLQVKEPEYWVKGVRNLVHPDYSYWTLGYVLSLSGAKKLLQARPLNKMLPVDEFLPVMFNKHPKWASLVSWNALNPI